MVCPQCGQSYAPQIRSPIDPVGDAVLPRSLRPMKIGGPVVAGIAVLAGVVVGLLLLFWNIFSHGH
jgi:hypothetical protein